MAVATGSSARPQVLTAGQQDSYRGTAGQQCFAHVVPMDYQCAAAWVVVQLLQVAAAAAAAAVQSAGMAAAGVVTRQVAAVALETLMMKPAAAADAAMGMSHKMEEIDLTERVADSAAQVVG